ncbi:MAG: hypothetical protein NTY53_17020 [Kiritimatiellaeota bacterium]|nr:hypothetical protein [Kiritimatiellota bacterium]
MNRKAASAKCQVERGLLMVAVLLLCGVVRGAGYGPAGYWPTGGVSVGTTYVTNSITNNFYFTNSVLPSYLTATQTVTLTDADTNLSFNVTNGASVFVDASASLTANRELSLDLVPQETVPQPLQLFIKTRPTIDSNPVANPYVLIARGAGVPALNGTYVWAGLCDMSIYGKGYMWTNTLGNSKAIRYEAANATFCFCDYPGYWYNVNWYWCTNANTPVGTYDASTGMKLPYPTVSFGTQDVTVLVNTNLVVALCSSLFAQGCFTNGGAAIGDFCYTNAGWALSLSAGQWGISNLPYTATVYTNGSDNVMLGRWAPVAEPSWHPPLVLYDTQAVTNNPGSDGTSLNVTGMPDPYSKQYLYSADFGGFWRRSDSDGIDYLTVIVTDTSTALPSYLPAGYVMHAGDMYDEVAGQWLLKAVASTSPTGTLTPVNTRYIWGDSWYNGVYAWDGTYWTDSTAGFYTDGDGIYDIATQTLQGYYSGVANSYYPDQTGGTSAFIPVEQIWGPDYAYTAPPQTNSIISTNIYKFNLTWGGHMMFPALNDTSTYAGDLPTLFNIAGQTITNKFNGTWDSRIWCLTGNRTYTVSNVMKITAPGKDYAGIWYYCNPARLLFGSTYAYLLHETFDSTGRAISGGDITPGPNFPRADGVTPATGTTNEFAHWGF